MITTQLTAATTVLRNDFGAITSMPAEATATARALLSAAIRAGKLSREYNNMEWHKRHGYIGWCLNYDFYDVTTHAVLVQRRETERTKYGTAPQKSYFIVRRCGRGVSVTEAPKSRVAKLAKIARNLGEVIDTLEGRAKKPLKQDAPFSVQLIGYKIMELRDGKYFSVFDEDFEWSLGKAKIEAASGNHTGGYYLFASVAEAKDAFSRNVVFNEAWQAGKELVLVECDYAGRVYRHDNKKLCATFCRPTKVLEVLGTVELAEAA